MIFCVSIYISMFLFCVLLVMNSPLIQFLTWLLLSNIFQLDGGMDMGSMMGGGGGMDMASMMQGMGGMPGMGGGMGGMDMDALMKQMGQMGGGDGGEPDSDDDDDGDGDDDDLPELEES